MLLKSDLRSYPTRPTLTATNLPSHPGTFCTTIRMLRKATRISRQDIQSKPVAICVIFLAAIYIRRLRVKRELGRELGRELASRNDPSSGARNETSTIAREYPDGTTELWVPYKNGRRLQRIKRTSDSRFDADYPKFSKPRRGFAKEISALLGILVPSYKSKVLRYLVLHIMMLGFRTYMSLLVADLDGRIVRHLIGANGPAFVAGLVEWLALAVPASYTNAMIRYLEDKISLEFRQSMIRYIHDIYIGPHAEYYKLNSMDGALEGIDHYITADVTKFSSATAKLYSNLGKPTLDLFIFAAQLSRNLGGRTMLAIAANYFITATVLRALSPAFGKLAARETQLEGDYRNAHARIVTNAEEIAFYDGAEIEKRSLGEAYAALTNHIAKTVSIKAIYSIIESYILKYSWSASGYLFAAVPVFFPKGDLLSNRKPQRKRGSGATAKKPSGLLLSATEQSQKEHSELQRERENIGEYVTNKRIMLSISDAGGRIMYSIKDMAELAGYTRRVYQLIAALHRVRKQAYHRTPHSRYGIIDSGGASKDADSTRHNSMVLEEAFEKPDQYTLADVHGNLEISEKADIVRFANVPVVVPGSGVDLSNGERIIDPLSFEVRRGQHLLIVGSNGTGKSSIARLAAGLWPIYRGLLLRSKSVSFLPQRPYFSTGTLRDQIIYPCTYDEMLQQKSATDEELHSILRRVNLDYLPDREGGLDVIKEWKDVFSGGEKQRMLFARLLFANPKFAIIDEGTSAVSADMEGKLYEECMAQGITLITISHRLSLLQYHEMKLEVGLGSDGMGWSFENKTQETAWRSMEKEYEDIKSFLATVPQLKQRREEIIELLKK